MRKTLLALVLIVTPIILSAQAPIGIPTSKFAWNEDAPTLADVQGYTYKYYLDGAVAGVAFVGVVCSGAASPFSCEVNIPAFTPGNHSITYTAQNIAGESSKSLPFGFAFVVTPAIPSGMRIK